MLLRPNKTPVTLQGPCDACSLIDGDTSEKAITKCRACDADLCEGCKGDWPRRARAAAIRAGRVVKKAVRHTHTATVIRTQAQRDTHGWMLNQKAPNEGGFR